MSNKWIITIRWLPCCLIFLWAGCKPETQYNKLVVTTADSLAQEAKMSRALNQLLRIQKNVKTGDLVTRTGNDFTSESLRSLNQRNQVYSHCGIASIEQDSVFVYHSLGGEWNPDQKIRRDPFLYFADPYNNRGIGVFHFQAADSILRNIQQTARRFFLDGVMFDMSFDLETDNRMYCAEFVYKSIEKASRKSLTFPHSHIRNFEFVGVDDIFLHPLCSARTQIVYK
jgi:hypothetical protein